MADRIQLEIVTPDQQFFSGEVEAVTVPGIDGYLGILPGHAALISELKPGVISYDSGGASQRLFCGAGFVEVLPGQVSVLAERALKPDEIDALITLAVELPRRFPAIVDANGVATPADIEFGFLDGRLMLFQIRPFLESASAQSSAYLKELDRGMRDLESMSVNMTEIPEQAPS